MYSETLLHSGTNLFVPNAFKTLSRYIGLDKPLGIHKRGLCYLKKYVVQYFHRYKSLVIAKKLSFQPNFLVSYNEEGTSRTHN